MYGMNEGERDSVSGKFIVYKEKDFHYIPNNKWKSSYKLGFQEKNKKRIYFLKCQGYIKIGISVNIKRRLKNIQVCNPFKITLLYSIQADIIQENILHKLFIKYGKHYRGEWFIYDPFTEKMIKIIKKYKDFGNKKEGFKRFFLKEY